MLFDLESKDVSHKFLLKKKTRNRQHQEPKAAPIDWWLHFNKTEKEKFTTLHRREKSISSSAVCCWKPQTNDSVRFSKIFFYFFLFIYFFFTLSPVLPPMRARSKSRLAQRDKRTAQRRKTSQVFVFCKRRHKLQSQLS